MYIYIQRLTPLYAGIIFFFTAFDGHLLGSGPNWNSSLYRSEDCRSYWWSHLLYINNKTPFLLTFVCILIPKSPKTIINGVFIYLFYYYFKCMPETWYLATEMQMFIFSPIAIYSLWRWPKRAGPVLLASLLAASFSYSTAIYLVWDLPPALMPIRLHVQFTI